MSFKVIGENCLVGTLRIKLMQSDTRINNTLDSNLKSWLREDGDWTLMQLGDGERQENVKVQNVEGTIKYLRPNVTFDHGKGTVFKFTANAYVVNEMITHRLSNS